MIVVKALEETPGFSRALRHASPDVATAARSALKQLLETPPPGRLRLHPLGGKKPTVWKIDVFTNHSWQIAFHLEGTTAKLLYLLPHSGMDRR